MGITAAALAGLLGWSCSSQARDERPRPDAATAPMGSAPALAAAPGSPPAGAPDDAIRAALGPEAIEIVEQATRVVVGRLRVVAADEALGAALRADDRIVGYPVRGALTTVSADEARSLAGLLLDPASYSGDVRRCRNGALVGLRFTRGERKVEFALGVECRQALWARVVSGRPEVLGRTLTPHAAGQLLKAASSSANAAD